jgi:hypothetical protein
LNLTCNPNINPYFNISFFIKTFEMRVTFACWLLLTLVVTKFSTGTKVEMDVSDRCRLGWEIRGQYVIVDVLAQTSGWLGVGISPTGRMEGSDICIAAINEDGRHYLNVINAKL